jgi:ribosome-associated protein
VDAETLTNVRYAADILARMKTIDIVILDLRGISSFTDYFLIASCASNRQIKAVCDELEKEFKAIGVKPLHIEGYPSGNWIILDYCDFVVHVFFEDTRKYYEIERLWNDAEKIRFEGINK